MTNKTFAFTKSKRTPLFPRQKRTPRLMKKCIVISADRSRNCRACSMRVSMHEWYHITFNILMIILEYSSIKWVYVNTAIITYCLAPRATDVECVDGDERDKKVLRTRETIILYPKLKIKWMCNWLMYRMITIHVHRNASLRVKSSAFFTYSNRVPML